MFMQFFIKEIIIVDILYNPWEYDNLFSNILHLTWCTCRDNPFVLNVNFFIVYIKNIICILFCIVRRLLFATFTTFILHISIKYWKPLYLMIFLWVIFLWVIFLFAMWTRGKVLTLLMIVGVFFIFVLPFIVLLVFSTFRTFCFYILLCSCACKAFPNSLKVIVVRFFASSIAESFYSYFSNIVTIIFWIIFSSGKGHEVALYLLYSSIDQHNF